MRRLLTVTLCLIAMIQFSAANEPIGSGDGRIHIIPTLSAPSVKNGEKLTIQAVVKAAAGVAAVEARISRVGAAPEGAPVAVFPLTAAQRSMSPLAASTGEAVGTFALYQAEWTAADLVEDYYQIELTVTDATGHTFTDRSLVFSDPIAGNNTVGTTDYADGGMRLVSDSRLPVEDNIGCAVIHAEAGYAYLGTRSYPGRVLKVALGDGDAAPVLVASLELGPDEHDLHTALIDPDAGYAYFCTSIIPFRIVKVALGEGDAPPTRIGALVLGENDNRISCALIDPTAGYGYFGTFIIPTGTHNTLGQVMKVRLGEGDSIPTRVGSVTFANEESVPKSGVIDPASGHAWFGTETWPGRVVKIALGEGDNPPVRIGAVTLSSGENVLHSAIIDAAAGYAWFGTSTVPGRVIKVALGNGEAPPYRVGAVTLADGETGLHDALIDSASGLAWFSTTSKPGRVVKVALGKADDAPIRIGSTTFSPDDGFVKTASISPATGYAFFATSQSNEHGYDAAGRYVKVALGSDSDLSTIVSRLLLPRGEHELYAGVIDPSFNYAWFGTSNRVVKFFLGEGDDPPRRVGGITLNTSETSLRCAVIDPEAGYALFGTYSNPAHVIKVALGDNDQPPVRIGAIWLPMGESRLTCAVLDRATGHAFFGTTTAPGRVVKVAMGEGDEPPTRIGSVTFNSGENSVSSAVIDEVGGHAFFGTKDHIVKVAFGDNDQPPIRVGSVQLGSGEETPTCGVIDPEAGYSYFGTQTSPARVVKIALGAGSSPPTRIGAVTLESGEWNARSAVIDPSAGVAYFGVGSDPCEVVKVALGRDDEPPARLGSILMPSGHWSPFGAVIDPLHGYAYFSTATQPGGLYKLALDSQVLRGTRLSLPEWAAIETVHFYSHQAGGSVRLGIYRGGVSPTLLWQSPPLENKTQEDWLSIPIAQGTPTQLILPVNDYWLAWQVDSAIHVGSYSTSSAGAGFSLAHPFNSLPSLIEGETFKLTSDIWSTYLTYESYYPMRIKTPLSNDILESDSLIDVQWWTDVSMAGESVRLELWKGDRWLLDLGQGWQAGGGDATTSIYLPPVPEADDYRIRAISWLDPQWSAFSGEFTITGGAVRVRWPRGGELWRSGTPEFVYWRSGVATAGTAVALELWRGERMVTTLRSDWDPAGEALTWLTVPWVTSGDNYHIRAVSTWNPSLFGDSGLFTIEGLASRNSARPESWMLYD